MNPIRHLIVFLFVLTAVAYATTVTPTYDHRNAGGDHLTVAYYHADDGSRGVAFIITDSRYTADAVVLLTPAEALEAAHLIREAKSHNNADILGEPGGLIVSATKNGGGVMLTKAVSVDADWYKSYVALSPEEAEAIYGAVAHAQTLAVQ